MTIRLDGGAPRACEYIGDSVTKTGHLFVEIEDARALSVIAAIICASVVLPVPGGP